MLRSLVSCCALLCLVACSKEAASPPAPINARDAAQSDPILHALAAQDRLADDAAEDEWRKPAEVLRMLNAQPGMRIVDYFAGGGYYSELLARLVGREGQVIAYNNPAYQQHAAEHTAKRYANERLANVAQLTSAPEDLPLEPASIDAALFVNAYHDLHWHSPDGSWPSTDASAALEKLAQALKPGAIVVVVDHVAQSGSDPAASVDALHRIDPEIVKRDFEAAGFALEEESSALRNSADDHSLSVFDPKIRHRTDRVMLRFVKR